jgi:hypothetical protein
MGMLRRELIRRIAPMIFLCFVFSSPVHAQSENQEVSNYYLNGNLGFGMIYGGLGSNVELGKGHFSGFGSFGYATKRVVDTTTINSTWNYMLGLRYYINANSDILFPRVGLGYGWITNYYTDQLANVDYMQKVEGLSLHLGVQFYTLDGLVVNFDLGMASNLAITQVDQHPYFFDFYLRPMIGVGYGITNLFGDADRSKHIKNKTIRPSY